MDDVTPERWLPVPGYEGFYEVSDWGRIKSLPRPRCRLRILKNSPMPSGYLQVSLSMQGIRHVCYVHRLVLLAFVGPCPKGLETRHGDGDKSNNRLSNLSYGTPEENAHDKIRHGTNRGPRANLTDAEVTAIRDAWQQGARVTDLAIQYGSSKAAISRLVNGRSYPSGKIPARPPEHCHYPGCDDFAEDGRDGRGLTLKFCPRPDHTHQAAKRERRRQRYHQRQKAA